MTPKFLLAVFFLLQVLSVEVHCGKLFPTPQSGQHLVNYMLQENDTVLYAGIHIGKGKVEIYQVFEKVPIVNSEEVKAMFVNPERMLYLSEDERKLYLKRNGPSGQEVSYDAFIPSTSITIEAAKQQFDNKKNDLEDNTIYGGMGPRVLTDVGGVQTAVVGDQGTFKRFAIEFESTTLK